MTSATPEWAIVRRRDISLADDVLDTSWESLVVPASRGLPFTDFASRRIGVPAGDHPTAVVVRAHELMHTTVSPMNLSSDVVEQLQLSQQAIVLAEEMRVNCLLNAHADELHVDMKALKDGSELRDVQAAIRGKDFVTVLSTVCTTMFAGAERAVAREAQAVYPIVRVFRKKAKQLLARGIREGWLGSTKARTHQTVRRVEDPDNADGTGYRDEYGLVNLPTGFAVYTLELARLIESMFPREGEGHGEYGDRVAEMNRDTDRGLIGGNWGVLRFGSVPLNGNGVGFLSRTRSASSFGRAPRRLHRLLTDPERRVFDRVARKSGGVVLVDGSGSMSLSSNDLRDIVRAAPGCLVAVYSYNDAVGPNCWVVARNGRYALPIDFPEIGQDNCVDLPAIEWAVGQRVRRDDPVIWVSDGHVTQPGRGMTHDACTEVVESCRKNRVVQVYDVDGAVALLKDASQGKNPTPSLVGFLRDLAVQLDRRAQRSTDKATA